jgi:xanthine dehydrogenase molybdenum-binding subunit
MPGMLHAKYVRSTVAHAIVRHVDAARALALPGVEAVFTFADIPRNLYATAGHPHSLQEAKRDKADRLLLTDHVRFFGDTVAVVVARNELIAAKAADLVVVEYAPLPVLLDKDACLAPDAQAIHPDGNLLGQGLFAEGGDLEEALASSDACLSGEFKTPVVQHCHMETVVSYAYMDDMDKITIVSSTQVPHIARRVAAQALGLPWSRVRVVKPCVGGGFGNKQDVLEEPMVAFLTWKLKGVPVRLALTREECFIGSRTRHRFDVKGRLGVNRDGKVTAVGLQTFVNSGGYASHGHVLTMAAARKTSYLLPHVAYRYEGNTYYSNLPAGGAMRGYGTPQSTYVVDCLLEEAARAIDMDPVELRIRNVCRPGDKNILSKVEMKSAGMVECLERGREVFDWENRRKACLNQTGPVRRGVGVGVFSYSSNIFPISVEISSVRLALTQDGMVVLQHGAPEVGQGSDTAFAQLVAEVVGIPFARVQVVSTLDTDVCPFDTGAYGSRQGFVIGPAIMEAGRNLKGKIVDFAAKLRGLPPMSLDLVDGNVVFSAQPEKAVCSLFDVGMHSHYEEKMGGQLTAEASSKTWINPGSFGCTFVDLDVDIPLCKVRIHEIVNLHECGRIINPKLAEGQVFGGMHMAIGWSLYEEMYFDPKTGAPLNNNLTDYKFPTAMDMPPLRCEFIDAKDPYSAFGNKGLGEPPTIPQAPAIRNAIWLATGVKINELPMTPQILYRHFKAAGLI